MIIIEKTVNWGKKVNDFPLPEKDDPNMTTMKDVAKAAGVSIATVSRVLAGNVPVTESTQKKVYAAMEELQYHSSTLQHAPGKKNLSLVAVCVQDLSDPCCMDVLRGVEDVLSISGYLPLLFNVDHDRACCQELLETLPAGPAAWCLSAVGPCSRSRSSCRTCHWF